MNHVKVNYYCHLLTWNEPFTEQSSHCKVIMNLKLICQSPNTSVMSVEEGTAEESNPYEKITRQEREEKRLAEMMIPKKKRRLYQKIMFKKKKKTQEVRLEVVSKSEMWHCCSGLSPFTSHVEEPLFQVNCSHAGLLHGHIGGGEFSPGTALFPPSIMLAIVL